MIEILLVLVLLVACAAAYFAWRASSTQAVDHSADFVALKARAEADAEALRALEKSLRDELVGNRRELADTLRAEQADSRERLDRLAESLQAKSEAVRAGVTESLRVQSETLVTRLDTFGATLRESLAKTDSESARRGEALAKLVAESLAGQSAELARRLDALAESLRAQQEASRAELTRLAGELNAKNEAVRAGVTESLRAQGETVATRLDALSASQRGALETLTTGNADRLEKLRDTIDRNLAGMREANEAKLDAMRVTVDEKLSATLETRLGETFRQVSERLDNVQKSFGEMQKMAGDVGDLKRVMTNVKTRGILGEYVLESLVEQVLTPEQFEKNWRPKKRGAASQDAVEIAVRLPGASEGEPVFLPIDAKFPKEDFEQILAAADRADAPMLEAARKALAARVESFAMDIRDKYVSPPSTTDFAILFLPAEGLYAEVVNRPGLIEKLQRLKITVAGPTTLLALLNSLNMGFRTLAIQKKSAEVWKTLQVVKVQVGSFGDILAKVHKKLEEASSTVVQATDRHRIMSDKLKKVEALPSGELATGDPELSLEEP